NYKRGIRKVVPRNYDPKGEGPSDTPLCYLCMCEHYGNILIDGGFLKCNSGARNSFTYDPNPESFNEVQSISNPPPQPHYNIYLRQICESNSHYGYDCSQRNLVPRPSEFEDDSECDVPACDDFITFSNLLFDADDDFSSSDNESFYDEDISKEIYLNPLFDKEITSMKIDPYHFNAESDLIESLLNHDSSIIYSSSKIDSLLDEFAGELTLLKSCPPGINETDCDPMEEIRLIEKLLYDNSSPHPPEEFISENSDAIIEYFSPSPILDDNYDSERDMLILEELLSNDSLSLSENESFHFDIPSSPHPLAKPLDDDEIKPNSRILAVKVVGDIYEHNVPIPRLLPTQPTLASNQEKSHHLLSHQGLKAFQLPS
nr:hypothetical protein [Tanacetum cinerariifolium]